MKLKRDAKFGEESTCHFKIGIKNLTNFDLSTWKIFTLIISFWAKYILFEVKSPEELSFMKLKRDTKFGEELTCRFKIDIRNLTNFNLNLTDFNQILIVSFWAKYISFKLKKSTEELCFMKLKRYTKFGEESTCHFKTDIRNFTNFDLNTQKSQKFSL